MIIGWKIWYTEGRKYSSLETEWKDLPDDGVLFLVTYKEEYEPNKRYRCKWHAMDWYGFDDDQLFVANNDTLQDNQNRYPTVNFKRGIWVSDEEYKEVEKEADDEYDLYT